MSLFFFIHLFTSSRRFANLFGNILLLGGGGGGGIGIGFSLALLIRSILKGGILAGNSPNIS